MKIAFVYDTIHPYVAGGVQKRVWELAWRMAQRGHSVTIFGMKYWDGDDIFFKEGVRLWGSANRSLCSMGTVAQLNGVVLCLESGRSAKQKSASTL